MPPGNVWQRNCFHPFGCVVNDSENEIATATVLRGSHQINVEMRKTSMRDGDWLQLQAGVAINLGPLAVEAGSRPGVDVGGKPSSDKSSKHHTRGGEPPQMWNVVKMESLFWISVGQWGKKCLLRHHEQGIKCLLGERQVGGKNRRASAAFLCSSFAIASKSTGSAAAETRTVSADSGGGGVGKSKTKNRQHFLNLADITSAHWTQKWKPNGAVGGVKWGQKTRDKAVTSGL
jgi:hypothetical protein